MALLSADRIMIALSARVVKQASFQKIITIIASRLAIRTTERISPMFSARTCCLVDKIDCVSTGVVLVEELREGEAIGKHSGILRKSQHVNINASNFFD